MLAAARAAAYPGRMRLAHATAFLLCVGAALLVLAGCGGSAASSESAREGARLFNEAGCAGCHSLVAAGARARAGPDLDAVAPDYAKVASQVRQGGGGMPAFAEKLSKAEIAQIAEFVSTSVGGGNEASASDAAAFVPDDTRLEDCEGRFACVEQSFGNLVYDDGARSALAEFDRRIATDALVEQNCHRIAHTMGAAALLRYDGRVGRAFAEGSASCWSGYYHGILERAFRDVGSNDLAPVSRKLCSDADVRSTAFIAYQCVHGLGHGLMLYTNYDMPRSLAVCDRLATGWDQTSCTGGVFMENISSSYGITSKWLRDDDPIYPCTAVAERHKLYCYLMVTSRILPFVSGDFSAAGEICRESETAWIATCFQSLGRDASGTTRGDVRRILALCATAAEMERECLYGAGRDLTSNDGGARRSRALCRAVNEAAQAYCFEGIGTILGSLHATPGAREAACRGVSAREPMRAACRTGAGLPG